MQTPRRTLTTFQTSAFSIFVGALLLLVPVRVYLQPPASKVNCPVTVEGEEETSSSQLTFSANPTNYQSYSWRVNSGEIAGPRNTASITVVNVAQGSSCKATVTIKHNGCQKSANYTTRVVPSLPNSPPTVSVSASSASITLACPEGTSSPTCTASPSLLVDLTADARDPDNDTLNYTWCVSGGKVTGQGRSVVWDLSREEPGTYTATVEVDDREGRPVKDSTTVTIAACSGCVPPAASGPSEKTARPKARKTDQWAKRPRI